MRNEALNAIVLHAHLPGAARTQRQICPARIRPRTVNGRRMDTLAALLALLSVAIPLRAAASSGCELLPPAVVSSVAGETVHLDSTPLREHSAGRSVCRYAGKDGVAFTFSVLSLESEGAARNAFKHELTRVFGESLRGELLRGVGAEARFGVSQPARDNTIVARHGVTLFVLAGHADQETLVILARSVIARLDRAGPE